MKLDELHSEEMYILVAPDGSPQVMTLAEDIPGSFASTNLLAKAGFSKSFESLIREGFRLMPVKVTIVQSGPIDEEINQKLGRPKGIKPKL